MNRNKKAPSPQMTFENIDVIALVAWMTFVLFEMHSMSSKDAAWYRHKAKRVPYSAPQWVFPLVWSILKGLIIASNYLFFKYSVSPTHWSFVAVFVLTVVNILMAKSWSVVFWSMRHLDEHKHTDSDKHSEAHYRHRLRRRAGMAWFIALLVFATAVAVVVIMGVVAGDNLSGSYLPMGLYVAYPAWLMVALFLNGMWYASEAGYYAGMDVEGRVRFGMRRANSQLSDPLAAAAAADDIAESARIRHRTTVN